MTPLLFTLEATQLSGVVTAYWACAIEDPGAEIEGGLYSHMGTGAGLFWLQADVFNDSRILAFDPEDSINFVWLEALQPWNVTFATGTNELNVRFSLLEDGSDEPLAPDLFFRIRRPPVALLSYGDSNRWGQAFLEEFYAVRQVGSVDTGVGGVV